MTVVFGQVDYYTRGHGSMEGTARSKLKPREPDTDVVNSMLSQGARLPTEILCTDSLGNSPVDNYAKFP